MAAFAHINKYIPRNLQKAADKASETLPMIIDGIFDHKSRSYIYCLSYRAACRRNGDDYFTAKKVLINLNEMFADPYLDVMTSTWNKVFYKLIPALAESHHTEFSERWQQLRADFIERASAINLDAGKRFDYILTQPAHMERRVGQEIKEVFGAFQMSTRGINRQPKRLVKSGMMDAYKMCAQDAGQIGIAPLNIRN